MPKRHGRYGGPVATCAPRAMAAADATARAVGAVSCVFRVGDEEPAARAQSTQGLAERGAELAARADSGEGTETCDRVERIPREPL